MASNNILQQIRDLINTAGLALEDALEQIVPGADPTYWRRLLDRADEETQNLASRQPRKPRRASNSRRTPSKRTNYAAQVVSQGQAMAEQAARVNGRGQAHDDGEETPGDTRSILVSANGRFHGILEVSNG